MRAKDPRPRNPERVSTSLEELAKRMGAPEVVDLASISAQWERLVGPDIAAHARPSKLKDDVLTVSVDHPAWASELRLLAAQLVQRLRQEAGSTIKSVTVQVGL